MTFTRIPTALIILSSAAFVLIWWFTAFILQNPNKQSAITPYSFVHYTPNMERDQLLLALEGNVESAQTLMKKWQEEAFLLENRGVRNIKHLNNQDIIALFSNHKSALKDDLGRPFSNKTFHKVLPQTYSSASILIALNAEKSITAIPQGLRDLQYLFPTFDLASIPLNAERSHSEAIWKESPEIAFVAEYSNPSSIEALKQQKLDIFYIKSPSTLNELLDSIVRIGILTGNESKAFEFTRFIYLAIVAIENRMEAFKQIVLNESPEFAILHYYDKWYLPTPNALTSDLLRRMDITPIFPEQNTMKWMIPITLETIVHYHPTKLIISAPLYTQQIEWGPIAKWQDLNSVCVDSEVQLCISQHAVLALYDLYYAIHKLYE